MKCVICKSGEMVSSKSSVSFESEFGYVVIKDTPVLKCDNCGEDYFPEEITDEILDQANILGKLESEFIVKNFICSRKLK